MYKGVHKAMALATNGYWKRWEAHKAVLQDLQETRALGKRVSGLGHAIIVEVQVTSSKNVPLSQEKKMKGSSLAKTRPKLLKLRTFQEESRGLYMSKKAPLCKLTCPERKKNMKL